MKILLGISFVILFVMMLPFAAIGFIFAIIATGYHIGVESFKMILDYIDRKS